MSDSHRRLAVLACIWLVACSDGGNGFEGAETTESTAEPIIYTPSTPAGQVVNWGFQYEYKKQGTAGRQLVGTSKGVCFISAVTGSFGFASDKVEVVPVDGMWVMRGTRVQLFPLPTINIGGDAFCVTGAGVTVSDEVPLAADLHYDLGFGSSTHTCFLSRVQNMTNAGSQVQVFQSGAKWAAETFGGATGAVRCINRPTISTGSITSGGHFMLFADSATLGHVCILTGVRGQLTSSSNWVGMRLDGSEPPYQWELQATIGNSGWAACVN